MEVSIRALSCYLENYKDKLEKKVDWDKHINVAYVWTHPMTQEKMEVLELKDVLVSSVHELFDLFSEFEEEELMGEGNGVITVDVKNRIVYILDHWIE